MNQKPRVKRQIPGHGNNAHAHHWWIDCEGNAECLKPGCKAKTYFENSKPTHFTFDGMGKLRRA